MRADHKHPASPAQAGDLAAVSAGDAEALGVLDRFVRADHQHPVDTGVAGDLVAVDGQAASEGTSAKIPRADHRHALGPLQANLDCNQKQLLGQVVHVAGSAPNPGAEVEGQIYYNSGVGDKHPYVWVP